MIIQCIEKCNRTMTNCVASITGESGTIYRATGCAQGDTVEFMAIINKPPIKIEPKFTPFHQQDERRKEQLKHNQRK